MKILSLLFSLVPFLCSGKFEPLLKEFMGRNLQLQINELDQSQTITARNLLRESKTWRLSGWVGYDDESPPYSFTIRKDLVSGTSIQLEWDRFSQETLGEVTTTKRSFGMSQDIGKNFFGRQFRTSLNASEENIRYSEIVLSEKNQAALMEFYSHYLRACLMKTFFALQQRSLKRSQERLKITTQKVKDGLNEKVDLYTSQMENIRRKEELESSKFSLKQAMNELSKHLYRPIKANEIQKISLETKELTRPTNFNIDKNLDIRKLKIQLRKLNYELEGLKLNYLPKLALQASYETRTQSSTLIPPSSGLTEDYKLLLSLQMPLNFRSETLNVAKKKTEITSLQMNRRQIIEKIKFSEMTLRKEIETHGKNFNFSHSRVQLSRKNFKENTRLYSIGRIDFDALLRAEEGLIETERSHINNWFQSELAVAKKASLHEALLKVIRKTKI